MLPRRPCSLNRLMVLAAAALATLAPLSLAPARAQQAEVPYWASLSAEEVYMRVGPSERYRIAWVYRRVGLPVKVLRLQQGWRFIEEPDGTRGWVFNQLITNHRTAIVTGEAPVPMRAEPQTGARLLWNVEPGVVGALGECRAGFCQLDVEGRAGWVAADRLWGDQAP